MVKFKMLIGIVFFCATAIKTGNHERSTLLQSIGVLGSMGSLAYWIPKGIEEFRKPYDKVDQAVFGRLVLDFGHMLSLSALVCPPENGRPDQSFMLFNTFGSLGSMALWLKCAKFFREEMQQNRRIARSTWFVVGSRLLLDAIIAGVSITELCS